MDKELKLPPRPRLPRNGESGLDRVFIAELLLKILELHGEMTLGDLAERACLSVPVIEPLLATMKNEALCEVLGGGAFVTSYVYRLTERGRSQAGIALARCRYAGPAPVPLAQYVEQIARQSVASLGVLRHDVERAFDAEVVQKGLLDQFGEALNSGRSIFVYGPAGTGKTYLAERMVRLFLGLVCVPHALLVHGEVIQVFDPLVHERVPDDAPELALDHRKAFDRRWVLCRRPVVKTGGELNMAMLDLRMEPYARIYEAPPQVKANNGLLIIDDLGRQLAAAAQIMNRWIVPLDRRVDYLTLHTGAKFSLPFDVIPIFSTNLQPSELADDAFLRRLGHKILVAPMSALEYEALFRKECTLLGIPFSAAAFRHLLHERHEKEGRPLLACLPHDLLAHVRDAAGYAGNKPELTPQALDHAWAGYFARDYAATSAAG